MRILEVAGDPPGFTSGLGRTVSQLVDGLALLGHKVESRCPRTRLGELKFSPIAATRFSDYDIVHVHGPTPFLSDFIAFNRSISHLVLTYHADVVWLSGPLSKFYDQLHLMAYKHCDAVIVESTEYAKRVGRLNSNVKLIRPPGPDWQCSGDPFPHKSPTFTVLYVGQFRPFKGIEVLLRAARRLPYARFVIAGNGYLQRRITESSRTIPNVEVRIQPTRDHLKRLYESAHVVCLPSTNTSEAFGFALAEGALFGALPVASNLPGVAENLEILGGFAFPPGDSMALTSLLARLSTDASKWRQLATESLSRAVKYARTNTEATFVKAHDCLFRNIVSD